MLSIGVGIVALSFFFVRVLKQPKTEATEEDLEEDEEEDEDEIDLDEYETDEEPEED